MEAILTWTHEKFGEKARLRYEALLARAIMDVAEAPERAGSHARPEIAPEARTYHLRHSGNRVRKSIGRVQRPRHFLLFRISGNGTVEIGSASSASWKINTSCLQTSRSALSSRKDAPVCIRSHGQGDDRRKDK